MYTWQCVWVVGVYNENHDLKLGTVVVLNIVSQPLILDSQGQRL